MRLRLTVVASSDCPCFRSARSPAMTIDMSCNVDKPKSATAPSNPISVPAQKPLTHIAQALRESIDAALTAEHLLVSAHGGLPPKCDTIKDFPMQSLPPLSTSSPKFDQQFERRLELQRKNEENAAKRMQITVQAVCGSMFLLWLCGTHNRVVALR